MLTFLRGFIYTFGVVLWLLIVKISLVWLHVNFVHLIWSMAITLQEMREMWKMRKTTEASSGRAENTLVLKWLTRTVVTVFVSEQLYLSVLTRTVTTVCVSEQLYLSVLTRTEKIDFQIRQKNSTICFICWIIFV